MPWNLHRPSSPIPLDDHARKNLRFIRETMERAGSFTAVPGGGGVAIGITAIGAAVIASRQASPRSWLIAWILEAAIAVAIGAWTIFSKARETGVSLAAGPARRFAYSFAPPVFVAAFLTLVLFRAGAAGLLPGIWLLLYGTAVVTGGAFSIRVVRLMGLCFMVLGTVALFCPSSWGNIQLATGFGGFHILFGAVIARNYGG
ncbi:MAG TPA: hypothetical protein VMJ93_08305 [Verrucomicrobiae bacterium]|nr:hypothetical protein [Verrucomicrobiae bacterium]